MAKYGYEITFSNGEILKSDEYFDEVYDCEEDAYDAALYAVSCCEIGQETLHLSNPGEYDAPDGRYDDYEVEIIRL